jgi:predicted nucleic acid-binding protein
MIVVSDTSPLTALLQIGKAEILTQLFSEVLIPPAVHSELLREHAVLPDWLRVKTPAQIPLAVSNAQLDAGETEALALALEIQADVLLIDERKGRAAARAVGLKVTGLLGCLILAKESGYLAHIAPVIVDLRLIAGCWFEENLVADVLRAAGE